MKVVIIGGVAGGASAAARLRRLDESAEIVMLERGAEISFANCGLPYYIGGDIKKKSALTLLSPELFRSRFNVDVRTRSEAVKIDPAGRSVTVKNLESGESYNESYDKLIYAPGASPITPPVKGADSPHVFTLRNIPDTVRIKEYIDDEFPDSAVIVGGGYIGLEMAENLKRSGVEVTVVEMAEHIIATLDLDMACDVQNYLREKGLKLLLGAKLGGIEEQSGKLSLKLSCGELVTDMVIMSVGVSPETALAREAGLKLNQRGAVVVNENMLTSDRDIYAVGDAVEIVKLVSGQKGQIPLAGPANKQGRIAADNICGIKSEYKGTQGSSVLKLFDMTVAVTGMSEAEAGASGIEFGKSFTYSPSHAGYYPGGSSMSVKTIYETGTGRILGAQLVGFDGVDKRCDIMAVAVRMKLTAHDLAELELCYAPPFSSAKDPVNFAGFVIENILSGKVNVFHWHEVDSLKRDGSVTLLDVRSPAEHAEGSIEGFINIPLDELRGRVNEIAADKPVYVHCHSGLRSYIACRILSGLGFSPYNLSGGYRLYSSVISSKKAADRCGCDK